MQHIQGYLKAYGFIPFVLFLLKTGVLRNILPFNLGLVGLGRKPAFSTFSLLMNRKKTTTIPGFWTQRPRPVCFS